MISANNVFRPLVSFSRQKTNSIENTLNPSSSVSTSDFTSTAVSSGSNVFSISLSSLALPYGNFYGPDTFLKYYGFDKINDTATQGSDQLIAIVVAYGSKTLQQDLDYFCSQYGIPTKTINQYFPTGTIDWNSIQLSNQFDWTVETTLDVSYCHASAPRADIALIVGTDTTINTLFSCIDFATKTLGADIIAMSFGTSEIADFYIEGYNNTFNENRSTIFVSGAGDNGAQVLFPGSSPDVLCVGGSTLIGGVASSYNINQGDFYEVAWSGSGGGVSTVIAIPEYQYPFNTGAGRSIPDVGYNAGAPTAIWMTDPTNNISNWYGVGGTSIGVPCWAGLLARKNSAGFSNIGDMKIHNQLYSEAIYNYYSLYNDVSSYNPGLYVASYGYDLVTGLGTPKAYNIVSELNTTIYPTPTDYVTSISFTNTLSNPLSTYNNEIVTNLYAQKRCGDNTSRPEYYFKNWLPLIGGSANSVVTLNMKNGGSYTFVYTIYGNNWILRRNNQSGNWTAVCNMFGGSKLGQSVGFSGSDVNTMRWGVSQLNSTSWSNLLLKPSLYTKVSNIVQMPY
jgi:subtilase family serine protease